MQRPRRSVGAGLLCRAPIGREQALVCVRRDCSVAESYRRALQAMTSKLRAKNHTSDRCRSTAKRGKAQVKSRDLKGFSTGHDITRARQCGQGSWERTV